MFRLLQLILSQHHGFQKKNLSKIFVISKLMIRSTAHDRNGVIV